MGINPSTARPIPMCQQFYCLQDDVNRISYNLVYEFRSSVRDSSLTSVVIIILSKSKTILLVVFDYEKDMKRKFHIVERP